MAQFLRETVPAIWSPARERLSGGAMGGTTAFRGDIQGLRALAVLSVGGLALAFLLAWLSYRVIERRLL
ncbi:hypothetical protein [Aurantiacibacter aquimixticola]|uniref:Uncharacterized protein n=1 Tax=Aurantiacibacter aquimixticola TaxID=1958945 RepID=A0A419RVF1_9SPHN|nr:hypothetical protein [Aurantiacibacter aquimixticola]RJY09761.1 hypothetical protein D6201_10720 [Aurantiacibacter aquimixticola]